MSICLGRFKEHSWDLWHAYDAIHERSWIFRRACQLSGCPAVEYAHEVQAVGPTIQRLDGSDPEVDSPDPDYFRGRG